MKTAQEFKEQAEKNDITEWHIRNCSICDYPLKYIFYKGNVFFDKGCDCTNSSSYVLAGWHDVADFYNRQTNEDVIKRMDEFWGFTSLETSTKQTVQQLTKQ